MRPGTLVSLTEALLTLKLKYELFYPARESTCYFPSLLMINEVMVPTDFHHAPSIIHCPYCDISQETNTSYISLHKYTQIFHHTTHSVL